MEERHGLAKEVLGIIHRRKNPVRRAFDCPPIFFEERRLDPCARHAPPLLGTYQVIDRLPHAVRVGLSQRASARTCAPLTTETTGGGYGRPQREQTCVGKRTAMDMG
jgi:hypothetical protein